MYTDFTTKEKKNKFRRAKIVLHAPELSDPRGPKHRHYDVRVPHPQEETRPLHVENSADKKTGVRQASKVQRGRYAREVWGEMMEGWNENGWKRRVISTSFDAIDYK